MGSFHQGLCGKTTVWLMEFRTFEDKASAINIDTGVNEQLAKMIQKHIEPDQKLAVGSLKYKKIIEQHLGISCLFDDCVLELMWGLKNCMHHLVPGEELELAKEDRLQMSKGMKMVLDGYGFDVKPEMVNECSIEAACVVYNCDYCVDKHSKSLHGAAKHLEEISGINPQGWSSMKIATALMMVCCPYQQLKPGDPREANNNILHMCSELVALHLTKTVIWVADNMCCVCFLFRFSQKRCVFSSVVERCTKI
ncbi:hypothetical protein PAHAL_8G033200 [Panicum hallii]|uniref:Uncharacterized protein n=1 Tax=Panicum hallii TaxID=206008 RepID=A0A2T8I7H0_9POAL|nr:uncharacterized protein LOC112901952 isoform X1 [Panicum hallii]PVH33613.1 hypothetical protein PAHAL_8G033200 [Panicum hallii]